MLAQGTTRAYLLLLSSDGSGCRLFALSSFSSAAHCRCGLVGRLVAQGRGVCRQTACLLTLNHLVWYVNGYVVGAFGPEIDVVIPDVVLLEKVSFGCTM